jgi:hypothetical protein
MASNFIEILNLLHDNDVEFVIAGGVAATLHGGSRVTFDIDIVPSFQNHWTESVTWTRFVDGVATRACWQ